MVNFREMEKDSVPEKQKESAVEKGRIDEIHKMEKKNLSVGCRFIRSHCRLLSGFVLLEYTFPPFDQFNYSPVPFLVVNSRNFFYSLESDLSENYPWQSVNFLDCRTLEIILILPSREIREEREIELSEEIRRFTTKKSKCQLF